MNNRFIIQVFVFISILSCACKEKLIAQNLVPNGSFEKLNECPDNVSQLYRAEGWYFPYIWPGTTLQNSCITDLYAACSSSNAIWSVNPNIVCCDLGCSEPADGQNYAGFDFFTSGSWKETIQTKLSEKLEANHWYKISLQAKLPEDPNSLNNIIGASVIEYAFTGDTTLMINIANTSNFPRQVFPCGVITDKQNWTKVEALYLASGDEQFLTIGYFGEISQLDIENGMTHADFMNGDFHCYYFIDNIQVTPFENVPNVFTPNGDGINDFWYIPTAMSSERINIINRWGVKVKSLTGTEKWDGTDFNGKNCTTGYYYFQSESENYTGIIYKL